MTQRLDFSYQIPDERLIAYSRLSIIERLRWLDEVRRFTLMVRAAPRVPPDDGRALREPEGGRLAR